MRRDAAENVFGRVDDPVAAWAMLDLDPLCELSAFGESVRDELDPRAASVGVVVSRAVATLCRDTGVARAAADAGLIDVFTEAVDEIMSEPVANACLVEARAGAAVLLARAIVASAQRRCDLALEMSTPVQGSDRDRLVVAISIALAPMVDRGVVRDLAVGGARLTWSVAGAPAVERRRRAITDAASPAAGDVMRYLARGQRMRDHVLSCLVDAPPPLVLVGHSLGGIMAMELLCTQEVAGVVALVTVGSQAPYLYELEALPILVDDLPASVPSWTNIYDPRDLLAFVAEPIFGRRVRDEVVDNECPFPRAHSAYVTNPRFYQILAGVLDATALR
jgi:hypothetical protein